MTADGKFDVTTDAAKTAFNELATMVTEDKVTDLEGLTGGADMEGYQQLYAGRNMIVPRGPWTISEGEQSFGLKLGTDFDYAAMPARSACDPDPNAKATIRSAFCSGNEISRNCR